MQDIIESVGSMTNESTSRKAHSTLGTYARFDLRTGLIQAAECICS